MPHSLPRSILPLLLLCLLLSNPAAISQDQFYQQPATGSTWRIIHRAGPPSPVYAAGSWDALESGALGAADFRPISPPDMAAGLGLATVYGPDTAGWFLAGGRRLHVATTDASRGYPTFSYESLARLGWAVCVSNTAKSSARIYYRATNESPLSLESFIRRGIQEAPGSNAWLLAAQVRLPEVEGVTLRRSPTEGRSMQGDAASRFLSAPVRERGVSALLVALVVRRDSSDATAAELRRRFFPPDMANAPDDLLIRIHYAPWQPPSPPIDPEKSLPSIWRVPMAEMPKVTAVREARSGSVDHATLSVWALGELRPAHLLYPPPDLVDVMELDPTILGEQHFATENNPFGVALYPSSRFLLRRPVAEAIVRVNQRLREQGYRLKLYDAYRPLSVTQRLWQMYQGLEVSTDTTHRYLAVPNVGSRHNRGAAVDCTITDLDGNELEMPSAYLDFSEAAHLTSKMTPEARRNLDILSRAMRAEGFTTIHDEWWHFDAPNWQNYRVLDEPFEPGGLRVAETGRRQAAQAPSDAIHTSLPSIDRAEAPSRRETGTRQDAVEPPPPPRQRPDPAGIVLALPDINSSHSEEASATPEMALPVPGERRTQPVRPQPTATPGRSAATDRITLTQQSDAGGWTQGGLVLFISAIAGMIVSGLVLCIMLFRGWRQNRG